MLKYTSMRLRSLILTALLLGLTIISHADTAAEKASYPYQVEIQQLTDHSDLVIFGRVYQIDELQRESKVLFQPEKVFKGTVEGPWVEVRTQNGKMFQDAQQPAFALQERCFLYLARHKDGYYECVNGATGKKQVLHENVYINPSSRLISVPLTKYQEALAKTQKAAS